MHFHSYNFYRQDTSKAPWDHEDNELVQEDLEIVKTMLKRIQKRMQSNVGGSNVQKDLREVKNMADSLCDMMEEEDVSVL